MTCWHIWTRKEWDSTTGKGGRFGDGRPRGSMGGRQDTKILKAKTRTTELRLLPHRSLLGRTARHSFQLRCGPIQLPRLFAPLSKNHPLRSSFRLKIRLPSNLRTHTQILPPSIYQTQDLKTDPPSQQVDLRKRALVVTTVGQDHGLRHTLDKELDQNGN